ncbi:hypothetical protein [Lentzea flaviverrucosa]|uniref:Uncharacterized protein n=1 Tax=Lentzea flaviverrucosa TaxID=200379 RepID=A0A1H9EN55_9PSEU|nr:hypothetical protein [Lentzea flaviverrucosa]RDI35448.1 hypothetical protein DFR72_1011199 [Lentzea flaviverrucosa]SEQ26653.1 hypothetical protein SAMN05216195_10218 [Lentzea flaviverrucosa]
MKTARQIRQELRTEEQQRRRARQEAVLAVAATGSAAAKELEAAERRKQALREKLEQDLAAEDAKIDARELAAGRSVVKALTGATLGAIGATFRDTELHRHTGIQLAVLRRWAKRAREADEQSASEVGSPERDSHPTSELGTHGGAGERESMSSSVVDAPVPAVDHGGRE